MDSGHNWTLLRHITSELFFLTFSQTRPCLSHSIHIEQWEQSHFSVRVHLGLLCLGLVLSFPLLGCVNIYHLLLYIINLLLVIKVDDFFTLE